MKDSLCNSDNKSDILKIIPRGKDKYEVYFNFLSLPVEMNKQFLEVIAKELKFNQDKLILN